MEQKSNFRPTMAEIRDFVNGNDITDQKARSYLKTLLRYYDNLRYNGVIPPGDEEEAVSETVEMPFGKHKGEKLCNVPAGYLVWLNDQEWLKDGPVKDYIRENYEDLVKETP